MIEFIELGVMFNVTNEIICEKMHISMDSDIFTRALDLVNDVQNIIKPAYIVKEVPVEKVFRDGVVMGGQLFNSKIIASKINGQKSVLIFIVTCGKDIGSFLGKISDPLDNYIVDQLAYIGYLNAMEDMLKVLSTKYVVGKFISLSPGSIIDWDVLEVKKFFVIMDGLYQRLNIHVLDSGLIDPLKSASGIIVRSDEEFESCDLCMRPNCPSRKTTFNQEKYDKMINL